MRFSDSDKAEGSRLIQEALEDFKTFSGANPTPGSSVLTSRGPPNEDSGHEDKSWPVNQSIREGCFGGPLTHLMLRGRNLPVWCLPHLLTHKPHTAIKIST